MDRKECRKMMKTNKGRRWKMKKSVGWGVCMKAIYCWAWPSTTPQPPCNLGFVFGATRKAQVPPRHRRALQSALLRGAAEERREQGGLMDAFDVGVTWVGQHFCWRARAPIYFCLELSKANHKDTHRFLGFHVLLKDVPTWPSGLLASEQNGGVDLSDAVVKQKTPSWTRFGLLGAQFRTFPPLGHRMLR